MDAELLSILVCPVCKGKLSFHAEEQELVCQFDMLAYPIRDNIPVMLPDEARSIKQEES